jgi:hypothetical protein
MLLAGFKEQMILTGFQEWMLLTGFQGVDAPYIFG